jgi:hypothetical protein
MYLTGRMFLFFPLIGHLIKKGRVLVKIALSYKLFTFLNIADVEWFIMSSDVLTSSFVIGAETVSEMLDHNSIFTWLLPKRFIALFLNI